MTHSDESELEMTRRHVQEAQEHIARQHEILDRLPDTGALADMARTLLAEYEETLALHRARLEQLQG